LKIFIFNFDYSHKFTKIGFKVNRQRRGYHRVNFDWIFSPLGVKGLISTDDVFFQGLTSIIFIKKKKEEGTGPFFGARVYPGSTDISSISVYLPSRLKSLILICLPES